jgi:hypothetical protein
MMKASCQSIIVYTTDMNSAQYQFADALMQRHIEKGDITEATYTFNWKSVRSKKPIYIGMKNQIFLAPLINSLPSIFLKPDAKMSIIGHGNETKPDVFIGDTGKSFSPADLAQQVVSWLTNSDGKISRIAMITLCMCWGAGQTDYDQDNGIDIIKWIRTPKDSFAYSFAAYLGQVTPLVSSFTMDVTASGTELTTKRPTGAPVQVSVRKNVNKTAGEFRIKFRVDPNSTLSKPLPPSFDDPVSNSH